MKIEGFVQQNQDNSIKTTLVALYDIVLFMSLCTIFFCKHYFMLICIFTCLVLILKLNLHCICDFIIFIFKLCFYLHYICVYFCVYILFVFAIFLCLYLHCTGTCGNKGHFSPQVEREATKSHQSR